MKPAVSGFSPVCQGNQDATCIKQTKDSYRTMRFDFRRVWSSLHADWRISGGLSAVFMDYILQTPQPQHSRPGPIYTVLISQDLLLNQFGHPQKQKL